MSTGRKHRRPLIGVTGPDRGGMAAWIFTRDAIVRAGGRAKRIHPASPCEIAELEGLVLGGGADITPELYGKQPASLSTAVEETKRVVKRRRTPKMSIVFAPFVFMLRKALRTTALAGPDAARDELEGRLLRDAIASGLPVLGICRGAQLINVHFGGTLHQSLEAFYAETPQLFTVLPKKTVEVLPRTHLAKLMGSGPCAVNAMHHQAVDVLGKGIVVAASEANGVIQAIEHRALRLCIGVQWHPEYIPQHPRQRALFRALVEAASTPQRVGEGRAQKKLAPATAASTAATAAMAATDEDAAAMESVR